MMYQEWLGYDPERGDIHGYTSEQMREVLQLRNRVYTVIAYLFGNKEKHSYLVGVYSNVETAIKAADTEEEWRGGKYLCEIQQTEVDQGCEGGKVPFAIVIKHIVAYN